MLLVHALKIGLAEVHVPQSAPQLAPVYEDSVERGEVLVRCLSEQCLSQRACERAVKDEAFVADVLLVRCHLIGVDNGGVLEDASDNLAALATGGFEHPET